MQASCKTSEIQSTGVGMGKGKDGPGEGRRGVVEGRRGVVVERRGVVEEKRRVVEGGEGKVVEGRRGVVESVKVPAVCTHTSQRNYELNHNISSVSKNDNHLL